MADNISAIPQQPQLGRLAQFLRFLETQNAPEFLPKQLDVMGLMAKLALPQASTVENLSYGNYPFTMPPAGTGAAIPQVKTGRKPEVADLVGMLGGVPGVGAVSDVATKLSNEAADAIVRAITRNPEATATGVIRETSMPFMQAVAPRTPGLLETPVKSELGFYSALEQAVGPLQNKGTGAQFLAQIEKTAGVKPEEVKWTGLDEFLKSRQNVTKQEVQDYLAANRVNLQEVRLAPKDQQSAIANYNAAGEALLKDYAAQGISESEANSYKAILTQGLMKPSTPLEEAYVKSYEYVRQPELKPKFSSYTLPGGENYREILLTLPESMEAKMFRDLELRVNAGERLKPEELQKYYDLVDAQAFKGQYFGPHYQQPNILAHMRVNDRVVDGKKTLFIEEIQSDWHQAGRKRGYKSETLGEKVSDADYRRAAELQRRRDVLGETLTAQESADLNEIMARHTRSIPAAQVPDAPFKTTWHELTLKRAIQEASEKGYDQIAFTTGKTQAERYDLSKQIDRVAITKTGGVWSVNAWKDGSKVITKDASTDSDLANLVGKELADKAVKQGGGEYAGLDLQVGGEGMKGFYDQILPKTLDKLGKKFDAKVGKTTMDGVEVWSMDITPKMRESVLTKGQPLFQFAPAAPAAGLLGGDEGE